MTFQRTGRLAVLALAAATATGRAAEPADTLPNPLTLDAAVATALATHDRIGMAESQQAAAEARVTQSRAAYYPRVTPSYQYSRQYTAFNAGDGVRTGTLTQNNTAVNLTQTLYDAGKREQNVARSRDALTAARYTVQSTRQDVVLSVTNCWYELLRSHALERVAESGLERARTTLEATRAFVAAGSSPRKDVLQAQADYANAQVQAIQAGNNVRLAETALKNAIGVVTTDPIGTPREAAAPAAEADTTPLREYIARAVTTRPDLKAAEASLQANRRGVSIARIEAGPQVTSSVSAGYRVDPDPGTESQFLVGVTYPLFDAGAARAAVREAQATVRAAEQQLDLSRRDIAAGVESAWLEREEARTRMSAARAALTAAQENYQAATESRAEGVGTILDVITAQNQLVTAETSAVQAVYDFHTADARLRYAVGALDVPVPEGAIS